ncbi:unnamed protein product [Strongylus vulgaris]|uniref:Uncharacterized protein n=1 Tax=Strongylus vulgaris TaxID=40348 RepID=A0A3P7JVX7_STRVU|nr:unnamed protein product [Strongylus vulgaris]
MNGSLYSEDAEVRVGIIVRPLRGHWRPISGEDSKDATILDPSMWKTAASEYNNEAKMQFISKMVYSNHELSEADTFQAKSEASKQLPQSGASKKELDNRVRLIAYK